MIIIIITYKMSFLFQTQYPWQCFFHLGSPGSVVSHSKEILVYKITPCIICT